MVYVDQTFSAYVDQTFPLPVLNNLNDVMVLHWFCSLCDFQKKQLLLLLSNCFTQKIVSSF